MYRPRNNSLAILQRTATTTFITTILPPLLPLPPIASTLLVHLRNTHNLKITPTLKVTKKNPTSAIGASNTITRSWESRSRAKVDIPSMYIRGYGGFCDMV
ncbi:hypothetical protein N7455_011188 [Penicillium solitum]|uniref:uncharacterized protein n=1 Tax=Penicillium solitum TaxID=60172 RepID=UPI00180BA0E0|nr:hypothetical protein HAV15_009941 [Penicillium sp. str. \